MRISKLAALLLAPLLLTSPLALPSAHAAATVTPPPPPPITDAQVLQCIKRGVEFLMKSKNAKDWEDAQPTYADGNNYPGAKDAAVLYSLLQVGKAIDDPRLAATSNELKPAIDFLENFAPDKIYVAALQANALALAPRRSENTNAITRVRDILLKAASPDGQYTYELTPPNAGDLSNTQFGMLGIWAVKEAGIEVPVDYWPRAEKLWRNFQNDDGGWGYHGKDGASRFSMTAAGVATLFLIEDQTWELGGVQKETDQAIERGLAYLVANFQNNFQTNFYTLYALERASLASGLRYIGPNDWYQIGLRQLIATQSPDGSWAGVVGNGFGEARINTAFALMFLVRGRNPLVFNKLQYEGRWNAHPRDDAHVTAWIGKQFERPLNWQVTNIDTSVDQWLDAPILLLNGPAIPHLTPAQILKLRQYIQRGGMIFSSANDGSPEFTAAIKLIAAEVTDHQAPMRQLPPDHPIFHSHASLKPPPTLFGISNGLREVWIHSPDDLSAIWQRKPLGHDPAFDLAGNVFVYATGKGELRNRLQTLVVQPSDDKPYRTLRLGRLIYDGQWDPEPGALPRLAQLAQANYHTDLQVHPVGFDDLDADTLAIVHLTGTAAFQFKSEQVTKLRHFLDNGGTLWTDSAGGNKPFNDSVLNLAKQLYPGEFLSQLPAANVITNGNFPEGEPATTARYRYYTLINVGKLDTPQLYALTRRGRLTIIASPYDMLSGLLGTNTWGINGYLADSAQALARNILLYIATQRPTLSPLSTTLPSEK